MRSILVIYVWVTTLIVGGMDVKAVPLEGSTELLAVEAIANGTTTSGDASNSTAIIGNVTEVQAQRQPQTQETESSATTPEQQQNGNFVGAAGTEMMPDQIASESHYDPSIYSGLFSPDAFQHYVNQFGAAAYAPYPAAAYPAPVGYGPPPPPAYHNPYSVQTGYEGYLVPASDSASSSTTTNTAIDASSPSALSSLLSPLTLLGSLFPAFMMSTLFRVITAVVSMIGMVLFGGAITTAICNLTPICDISFKAVTYLRRRGTAERVSRMIADEMTPERVRRATEFVRTAIRKYRDLQRLQGVMLSE